MDIRFVQTCGCCPEQYDAYLGDKYVGYVRERGGSFTVEYPGKDDCERELLFSAYSDEGFSSQWMLKKARRAIWKKIISIL